MSKKVVLLIVGIIIVVLAIIGLYVYSSFFAPVDIDAALAELGNPGETLTIEEAIEKFDESFVTYLLYSIGASGLKNAPFSDDRPEIEIYVDADVYNAYVESGVVSVARGEIEGEDIRIRTNAREAVLMIQNREYIFESFSEGKSSMELVSDQKDLGLKGYLKIYNALVG